MILRDKYSHDYNVIFLCNSVTVLMNLLDSDKLKSQILTLFKQEFFAVPHVQFDPHFKLNPLQGQPLRFPSCSFRGKVHLDLHLQPATDSRP